MEKREQQSHGAIDRPITLTNIIELVNHGWKVSFDQPYSVVPCIVATIIEPVTGVRARVEVNLDHLKAYRFMGDHTIDTMFRDAVFELMRQRAVITANNPQDQ